MIGLVHLRQFALEVHLDLKVQITVVPFVRLHLERTKHLFALLHRHVLVKVEHGLLPVRVGRLGRRTEAQTLVALGELDVEVGDERLHEIVALND